MNKKIISFLLLSVCFFVFASGLFACGDSLKTTNDENLIGSNSNLEFEITNDNGISYSVVGYKEFFNDERDNEIVIPSIYKGRPVTSIGNSAFFCCRNLTSLEIPSSVKSIGSDAFSGCDKLDIREYDNGYYLGNKDNPYIAFIKVKNKYLESCLINNDCMVIGNDTFSHCKRLTSIEIPSSVTSIGSSAFFCCRNLTSLEIPSTVKSIGSDAFSGCDKLDIR